MAKLTTEDKELINENVYDMELTKVVEELVARVPYMEEEIRDHLVGVMIDDIENEDE